jgi:serine O-acetyltransferase
LILIFRFEVSIANRLHYIVKPNLMGDKMAEKSTKLAELDPVWHSLVAEGKKVVEREPLMGSLVHSSVLHHDTLEKTLAYRFSLKLSSDEMPAQILREIADKALASDPWLGVAARADLVAVKDRDPACHTYIQPLLFFKGYQAVQAFRIAHWLWTQGRKELAYFVQMRVSEVFGVDIHPGAVIGKGIMIDHAHSIVIGETAVVGDNVSMLHSVTLGGTGKADGDRHPKIENGVLIGAGAKVLGNIRIGYCTRIAAGSVVLKDIPPLKTVAGVPAKIVGESGCSQPSQSMDQLLE